MIDDKDVGHNCGNCRFSRPDMKNLEQRSCVIEPPASIALPSPNGQVQWMASVTPVPASHWCGKHELVD